MIIQPGIAKANLGVSREDVTLEDHVSVVKPLCYKKFLGVFLVPWAAPGSVPSSSALPEGGMAPSWQP